MGQTVCRYRGSGPNKEFSCYFEETPFLRDLLRSNCYVSPLSTDYGCSNRSNDHIGLLMIHFVSVMLLLIIWILSCVIQAVDFTRSYVISMILPLTALALANFISSLNANFHFYWTYSYFWRLFDDIKWLTPTMVDVSIALGSFVYLLMTIATARNRQEPGCAMTWIPYLFSTAVAVFVGWIGWNFFRELKFAISVVYGACVILLCFIPFACCCCSSPRPSQSLSPVVTNARSRMGWAFPFVVVVLLPPIARIALEQLATNHSYTYDSRDYSNLFLHICMLITYFQPIIVSIGAILLLPAYRSPLCCDQGQAQGKVMDSSYQKNVAVALATQANVPTATSLQPVVTAQPTSSQGYPDPNLISYLTNPSVNQPNLQPFKPKTTVPSGHVCPNCTASQHQSLQQPQYVVQSHVPMQPLIVAHPQLIVQPSTMVRYASQPNLVHYNTLQPGVSMPNLVEPESPYYIHS